MSPNELERYLGEYREVIMRNRPPLLGIVAREEGRWRVGDTHIEPSEVADVRKAVERHSFARDNPAIRAELFDPPGARLGERARRSPRPDDWRRLEAADDAWRYVRNADIPWLRVHVRANGGTVVVSSPEFCEDLVVAATTGWEVMQKDPLTLRIGIPTPFYVFASPPPRNCDRRPLTGDGHLADEDD